MGFEYRDAWIVVRSESTDDVLKALNSRSLRDCTWSEGAAQSLSTAPRTIFISAPVDGEIWCAGQRFVGFTRDGELADARFSSLARDLRAQVRIPSRSEVERIADRAPGGFLAREHWTAPPLEGSSMTEPAPPSSLQSLPGLTRVSTLPNVELAARGDTFARWVAEAFVVFRSLRPSHVSNNPYQQPLPNAAAEPWLIVGIVILFEIAVFIANIFDKRQTPDAQPRFRSRVTRILVALAGASIVCAALYVDDPLLLMAGGFVVLGGLIAASYIPDALFGGTKPVYD